MRITLALVGLLLAGTIATFLRTVSMWSTLMAALVFTGMLLTFLLGVFTGWGHVLPRKLRRTPKDPVITLRMSEGSKPSSRPQTLASR